MSTNLTLGKASTRVDLYQTPTQVTQDLLGKGNTQSIMEAYLLWARKWKSLPEIPADVVKWILSPPEVSSDADEWDVSPRDSLKLRFIDSFGYAPVYRSLIPKIESIQEYVLHEKEVREAVRRGARFSSI